MYYVIGFPCSCSKQALHTSFWTRRQCRVAMLSNKAIAHVTTSALETIGPHNRQSSLSCRCYYSASRLCSRVCDKPYSQPCRQLASYTAVVPADFVYTTRVPTRRKRPVGRWVVGFTPIYFHLGTKQHPSISHRVWKAVVSF